MSLKISYNTHKVLYNEYLQIIGDIKFTFREVDVIACIVNNRGDKKIAYILSIAPRTVSVHSYNIMQKLGCNSKEGIIDFVESSNTFKLLRQYYSILLVKSNFDKQLKQIVPKQRYCILYSSGNNKEQVDFYQSVKNHLMVVGIDVLTDSCSDNSIGKNQIIEDYTVIIDDINKDEYYPEIMNLISTVVNSKQTKQISLDFHKSYLSITNSVDKIEICKKEVIDSKNKVQNYVIAIVITAFIFVSIYLVLNMKTSHVSKEEIYHEISELIGEFSIDNINTKQLSNNFNLVHDLENSITQLQKIKLDGQLDNLHTTDKELVDFVYMISAMSNYYLFNHDWERARATLLISNDLIHSHINKRIKVPLDMGKLDSDELYAELSIVKDLPEIYTQVLYFLGRTFIYEKNKEGGLEYFKKAQYLGMKLNLFEGYLSIRSGIGVIKLERVKSLLNSKKDIAVLKKDLIEYIGIYERLRDDRNSYIVDYKPSSANRNYIIPSQDLYNQIECTQQIIQSYMYLLDIDDDELQQKIYAFTIVQNFLNEQGLLNLISNSNLASRKIARIYNLLGEVLLLLHDKKINFIEEQKLIASKLKLSERDLLDLTYDIFLIGKKHSRNVDFTKADSYNGMFEVISRKLKRAGLTDQQKNQLKNSARECIIKRDKINKDLAR